MANVEFGEYEWIDHLINAGAGAATTIVSDVNKTKQTKITTDSANYIASLGAGTQNAGTQNAGTQNAVSNLPLYVIGAAVLLVGGFVLTRGRGYDRKKK